MHRPRLQRWSIHLARWNAWRCVILQPPTFRKASCLHLRHLGSPKRTPDHSKWRHMADYLNLQKTSSALHFAQSIGKQPFRTSNPYHSETGLYQKCKGPKLFPFRQVPFHIGTKVRILGLQRFSATDRFPLRPRSVYNRYHCIKKRAAGKHNLYNICNLVKQSTFNEKLQHKTNTLKLTDAPNGICC